MGLVVRTRVRRAGARFRYRNVWSKPSRSVADVPAWARCPDCGGTLMGKGMRERTVLDCRPVKVERIVPGRGTAPLAGVRLPWPGYGSPGRGTAPAVARGRGPLPWPAAVARYRLPRRRCRRCGRTVQTAAPGVLAKSQYGNGLLTHVAVQHYLYGATLGQLEKQTGIGYGSLVDAMHQVAGRLAAVIPRLQTAYRHAPVRHADETGWRRDGSGGYAWLFNTATLSLFRLQPTRAASVVRETLGKRRLSGVLVVDRYGGYNRAPCRIQYCYAHLLRDVQDMGKKFPDDAEIRRFVATLTPIPSPSCSPPIAPSPRN